MDAVINAQVATTDFLELLTIQLQNQDPLSPVKQEDFIAQLAQFSQLENSEAMNTSFDSLLKMQEVSQGLDMVGKNIDYLDPASSEMMSGRVDEFFVDQGIVKLMVNGTSISVDQIASVKADPIL